MGINFWVFEEKVLPLRPKKSKINEQLHTSDECYCFGAEDKVRKDKVLYPSTTNLLFINKLLAFIKIFFK